VRCRLAACTAAAAIVLAVGCKSAPTRPSGDLTGAPTARGAVERFLAAIRAQDLQAMSVVWGTKNGLLRDMVSRDELEKREVVLAQCLAHDSASFLDESPTTGGDRLVRYELYHGSVSRATTFTTESAADSRWYVKEIDLRDVHACTVQAGQPVR